MVTSTFLHGVDGYTSGQDTYIDVVQPDRSHADSTSIRWVGSGVAIQRAGLLQFNDIFGSDRSQIPAGVTIISATLRVFMSNPTAEPPGAIREATVAWDETVTWNSFGNSAGVQPDEFGVFVADAPVEPTGFFLIDVTESLKRWSADPATNRGWIVLPEPTVTDLGLLRSNEEPTSSERPRLTVVWTR